MAFTWLTVEKAFSFVGRGGENLIVDALESESNYVNSIEEYYGLWYSYQISVKYLQLLLALVIWIH